MKKFLSILFLVSCFAVYLTFCVDASNKYVTYGSLDYEIYNNSATVYDCAKSATNVDIPSEINGMPVISIGPEAFWYCDNLTSVTIPEGVTNIGYEAFYECKNLKSIVIPEGVTNIGYSAFEYCKKLSSVIIPKSVTKIGNKAFAYCNNLENVVINGVTSIGKHAFYGCYNIQSITLPDGINSIDEYAFAHCSKLSSITIPDSVAKIGGGAFSYCDNLTILCYSGSYGEHYAKINNIPYKTISNRSNLSITGENTTQSGSIITLVASCNDNNGNIYTDNISWHSSGYNIVEITPNKNVLSVKGLRSGKTTITATHTPSGATASMEITVVGSKSYEEYFADNIDPYINQITGLELPYRAITAKAAKQGLIDWSLGLNQYWRSENGVAQGGEGHKRYFYNTVLLDLINKKFTSNDYKESLKSETWSAMKDITDVMLTQVMNKVETNVDSTVDHWKNYGDKEDLFERFFVQDQLSSAERMKSTVNFANDFIDSADMFLTMEDFANTYSDYRTAYVESMQQVFALEAIKAQIGTKSSDLYKAVDDITFVLKDSQTEAFGHGIKNGCWQIFMTTIWTTAELVPGLGDALEMLNASLSVWQLGTDVLVPATCTLDSLCRMQAICEIEDACKQALNASYKKYKADPCYDNAVELIGIYDFLMTIYEYGHNDSKVYADYYYNEGLLKIGDISEWIYGDSYESTMAWLNSYNGAIEDVKWYKSKAEIEYLNAQGVSSTVTVNIYCNGKIVGTMTYEQPYGSTFSILPIEGMQQVKEFKDIKLVKQYSDAYYDKAMTQRFQNPHLLTNPITLHVNVTLLKRVDITIPEFKVTLNGVPMDNKYLSYPAIVYNNITYFPMTFYDSRHMGLSTEYSLTNGLRINQYNTPLEKYEKITTTTPNIGQYEATIAEFPIYVNDKNINNFMEEYPLLLFRDVTYFPLTWRFAVEEFGWSYYFDTTDGLVINK